MTSSKTIVGSIDNSVLAFTVGNDSVLDMNLVAVDCIGSVAHAKMLSCLDLDKELFSESDFDAVRKELVEIIQDADFSISVDDQDVHMAVESRLTDKLGYLGKKIHTGRSRNDQVALDLRLFGKEQLIKVMQLTLNLAKGLLQFAEVNKDLPMVGRTHLQPAMPSGVGLWASCYAEGLLDDFILLKSAYEFNDRCPLGSAAGYGVSLAIDRHMTSDLLGFSEPIQNVMYASNSRGKCESVILSSLSQIMINLSRLAEDLIIFSMPEFNYFSIPKDYCTGSSIMPQKSNPDVCELIRGKASKVHGFAGMARDIVTSLPGGYNRDLQEIKEPFMEGIAITEGCLDIMCRLVEKLESNKDALYAGFSSGVFATDKAIDLVVAGMPFREAYEKVKAMLSELGNMDVMESIKNKNHYGAANGLDFCEYADNVALKQEFIDEVCSEYCHKISELLGIEYQIKNG
jgi:argininosuccinate lyase